MSLYPEALADLARACEQYRERVIGEEELQVCLETGVRTILAIEENDLRSFLRRAEGKVELIRFTVDCDQIRPRVLEVVSEIEGRLSKA